MAYNTRFTESWERSLDAEILELYREFALETYPVRERAYREARLTLLRKSWLAYARVLWQYKRLANKDQATENRIKQIQTKLQAFECHGKELVKQLEELDRKRPRDRKKS